MFLWFCVCVCVCFGARVVASSSIVLRDNVLCIFLWFIRFYECFAIILRNVKKISFSFNLESWQGPHGQPCEISSRSRRRWIVGISHELDSLDTTNQSIEKMTTHMRHDDDDGLRETRDIEVRTYLFLKYEKQNKNQPTNPTENGHPTSGYTILNSIRFSSSSSSRFLSHAETHKKFVIRNYSPRGKNIKSFTKNRPTFYWTYRIYQYWIRSLSFRSRVHGFSLCEHKKKKAQFATTHREEKTSKPNHSQK